LARHHDDAATWTPAELRFGKLFVPMTLNGERMDGVFYDSGSSALTLDVDLADWKRLTGKASEKEATSKVDGHAWGHDVVEIVAPAKGDLIIANRTFSHPTISTEPAKPTSYKDMGAQDLLGNQPFLSDIVVLDMGVHPASAC
jgi:hypothetical protein